MKRNSEGGGYFPRVFRLGFRLPLSSIEIRLESTEIRLASSCCGTSARASQRE